MSSNELNLTYFVQTRGKNKTVLRIPESHSLHICPSSCGRKIAFRAYQNGQKANTSFMYIKEVDAVSGDYENSIEEAVEMLLDVLDPAPKAFILYFNCIDDFLGTDEKALLDRLLSRFPAVRFTVCRIDPVAANEKFSPGMRLHNQMYTLLEYTGKKDNSINLLGNYTAIDQQCELYTVLAGWGFDKVRQLFDCKTFAEYRAMADSSLNLVLMPTGRLAACKMAEILDIPFLDSPIIYDITEVMTYYSELAATLGKPCPDFQKELLQTKHTVQVVRELLDGSPVIIDSSASMRPFSLAKALVGYGFCVGAVIGSHPKDDDSMAYDWLSQNHREITLISKEGVKDISGYHFGNHSILLGSTGSYLASTGHVVDMFNDESFFGFYGIQKLMHLISKAYQSDDGAVRRD
jgi:nitrogenase molybdenum-iron protein alpha/beta subunit